MDQQDIELLNKIRDFIKIEKEVEALYAVGPFNIGDSKIREQIPRWYEGVFSLNEIRHELAARPAFVVQDRGVSKMLDRIRSGREFKSVLLIDTLLLGMHQVRVDVDPDEAIIELAANYDHVKYSLRKIEIGALISLRNIDRDVQVYFSEAREAYALRLNKSCIALCRALLEQSLLAKDKTASGDLSDMIERVLRNPSELELKKKAHRVRNEANDVLHLDPKGAKQAASAKEVLLDTMDVVEYLHGRMR